MTDFDSRMTEESKRFSVTFNQMADGLIADLVQFRQYTDLFDAQLNSAAYFDGLNVEEHLLRNTNDNFEIPVTTYVPKNKTANTTIVIFYHGGGFQFLTRKSYHRAVANVAQKTNTIWITMDYHLSPEYKYPLAIQDCSIVTKWVLENKHELFGSAVDVKVGVAGDSAGGNLAVNMAHEFREKLAFQILIYPWLDMTSDSDSYREFTAPCFVLRPDLLVKMIDEYVPERQDRKLPSISPVFHTYFNGIPKTLVVNSELDPLREDGRKYADKVREANIESEYHVVQGVLHGFFHAYDLYKNAHEVGTQHIINFLNSI